MSSNNVNELGGLECGLAGQRLPVAACEALDLKRILIDLADQIADADRRHSKALLAMQVRLGALDGAARDLREQLPAEMSPAIDRIQGSMTQLADHLADSEAQRRSPATTRAELANSADAAPALKSALSADVLDAFAKRAQIARANAGAEFDNFDVVDHGPSGRDTENWDATSADALARLYETGQAEAGADVAELARETPIATAIVAPAVEPQPAPVAAPLPLLPEAIASPQVELLAGEREWLDGRFNDIALRLEQSIAGLGADGRLDSIDARFTGLERKIGEALVAAQSRSDLDGLKSIESQVEDLTAQLVTVQTHFSRLDTIELELRSLAERLSNEKLAKMMEAGAPKAADNDALAGAVASRVAKEIPRLEEKLQALSDRLSTEKIAALMSQNGPAMPDTGAIARMVADLVGQQLPKASAAGGVSAARIDDLRRMIESTAAEQRHGEEQINAMLDTMQQALIRLLDRMDSLEQTRLADAPVDEHDQAYAEPQDYAAPAQRTYAAGGEYAQQPAYQDEPQHSRTAHAVAAGAGAAAAAVAYHQTATAYQPQQADAYQPEPAPVAVAPAASSPRLVRPEPKPADSREDFIASARRAARNAAAAPPEAAAEPEEAAPAKATAKSGKQAGKSSSKSSGRSLSRASMALLCLVLVGASFAAVKTTILAPSKPAVQPSAPMQKSTSSRNSEADQRVRNLEDADVLIEDNAKAGPRNNAGQSTTVPQRNSGGFDGTAVSSFPTASLQNFGSFPASPGDLAHQSLQGAPAIPTALTKDNPSLGARAANPMPPLTIGPNSLRTAAAKGDASAEYEIGVRFAEGKGVPQDLQQAVAWYQRSASQGFAPAQYRLGSMFERGLGLKADLARARVWYQRAAEQGIVKAMHNLAVLTAGRDSAATDYAAAAKWFQSAADHGLTDSQFNLAIMHDSGLGMERDAKQAYKWFSLAARAGDDEAARRRESLRAKLAPHELAEVESTIQAWRPRQSDPAINDPKQAGEVWKQRVR